MATLKNTIHDPSVVEDVIGVKESSEKKATVESIRNALGLWEAFKKTRAYTIASNLIDPKIRNLTRMLKLSRVEVKRRLDMPLATDMDVECFYSEVRAEIRVWEILKYEPWRLEAQLRELEPKGGAEGEKPVSVPDVVKQYLD